MNSDSGEGMNMLVGVVVVVERVTIALVGVVLVVRVFATLCIALLVFSHFFSLLCLGWLYVRSYTYSLHFCIIRFSSLVCASV